MTISQPTAQSAEAPATSLYSLALESQAIDGELAIALAKLESEDPDEQAEAEQLVTGLLERAAGTQGLIERKASAICHIYEGLVGRAAYLRGVAAARAEQAAAEERNAERLLTYLARTLSALHPGQKKFTLPEHTVASRSSEGVVIDPDDFSANAQNPYCRTEVTVKLAAGTKQVEAADNLVAAATELLRDVSQLGLGDFEIRVKHDPDKASIKKALKAGASIAGADLEKRLLWSIK
jgi:hypothetical protein